MPKLTTPLPKNTPPSKKPNDTTPLTPQKNPTTRGTTFAALDDQRTHIKALLYGLEGSGKTSAAAAMANLGKVLFINAEGGLKKTALTKLGINTANIAIYPPPGQPLTYEGLETAYAQIQADLARDPDAWAGVVLDSATEVYQVILAEASERRTARLTEQGKEPDRWFTDLADYGTMSKQFRFLLRKLRDLPCHLVVTALERRDVDEDTGKVQYGPAVSPAVATDLLGYVDMVLVHKAPSDGKPFRAATGNVGKYRAKDRLNVLPCTLNNPSFERIAGYATGHLTEETDPLQQPQKHHDTGSQTPTQAVEENTKNTTNNTKEANNNA